MIPAEKAKIIDKIRKLLALSKSDNEAEASLAAEKASALMRDYQVSFSSVELESIRSGGDQIVEEPYEVKGLRMKYHWVGYIGHAAALLFDGTTLMDHSLHGTRIRFVGFASDIPAMQATFDHLYNSWHSFVELDLIRAKRDRRETAKDMYPDNPRDAATAAAWTPADTMKFKLGHGQGYASRLVQRCQKIAADRNAVVEAESNNCTALVVVRQDALIQYGKTHHWRTGRVNQQTGAVDGYSAGYAAGNKVSIGGALNSGQAIGRLN